MDRQLRQAWREYLETGDADRYLQIKTRECLPLAALQTRDCRKSLSYLPEDIKQKIFNRAKAYNDADGRSPTEWVQYTRCRLTSRVDNVVQAIVFSIRNAPGHPDCRLDMAVDLRYNYEHYLDELIHNFYEDLLELDIYPHEEIPDTRYPGYIELNMHFDQYHEYLRKLLYERFVPELCEEARSPGIHTERRGNVRLPGTPLVGDWASSGSGIRTSEGFSRLSLRHSSIPESL